MQPEQVRPLLQHSASASSMESLLQEGVRSAHQMCTQSASCHSEACCQGVVEESKVSDTSAILPLHKVPPYLQTLVCYSCCAVDDWSTLPRSEHKQPSLVPVPPLQQRLQQRHSGFYSDIEQLESHWNGLDGSRKIMYAQMAMLTR